MVWFDARRYFGIWMKQGSRLVVAKHNELSQMMQAKRLKRQILIIENASLLPNRSMKLDVLFQCF